MENALLIFQLFGFFLFMQISFWVDFPVALDSSGTMSAPNRHKKGSGEEPETSSLLLYVEDNAPNLKLMQHILSKRPTVRLLPATAGEAGVQLARAHFPDLILLDLQLPDMHGVVVLQHLSRDESTRTIPVVILSADATPRQIERLLKVGAQDYLTKPFDVSQLLRVIDALLEKKQGKAH